jgi:hypothetical protein
MKKQDLRLYLPGVVAFNYPFVRHHGFFLGQPRLNSPLWRE